MKDIMRLVRAVHGDFGAAYLPLLIVIAAIWFTVTWKPDAPRGWPTRIFLILVDLQATLGILYWAYLIFLATSAGINSEYIQFPFILHPILGLVSAAVAHMATGQRGMFSRLGRWAALVGLAILLALVIGGALIARMA